MAELAKKIVVTPDGGVVINGVELPWFILDDWTVTHEGIARFNCSILAEEIVIGGESTRRVEG